MPRLGCMRAYSCAIVVRERGWMGGAIRARRQQGACQAALMSIEESPRRGAWKSPSD